MLTNTGFAPSEIAPISTNPRTMSLGEFASEVSDQSMVNLLKSNPRTAEMMAKLTDEESILAAKNFKKVIAELGAEDSNEARLWRKQLEDTVIDERMLKREQELGPALARAHPESPAPGGSMADATAAVVNGTATPEQILHVSSVRDDLLEALGRDATDLDPSVPHTTAVADEVMQKGLAAVDDLSTVPEGALGLTGKNWQTPKTQPTSLGGRVARKAGRGAAEAWTLSTRPLTLAFDLMVGRQGVRAVLSHPLTAGGAVLKTVPKAYFTKGGPKWAQQEIEEIVNSDTGKFFRDVLGLPLMKWDEKMSLREEQFMFNGWTNIPGIKQTAGALYKRAEYANILMLNKIRHDTLAMLIKNEGLLKDLTEEQITEARSLGLGHLIRDENTPTRGFIVKKRGVTLEHAKGLAATVSQLTGRGHAGEKVRELMPALNLIFLSPSLNLARVQAFTDPILPGVLGGAVGGAARKEAVRALMAQAGLVATGLTLAHMMGLDAGINLRATNFGKVRANGVDYDLANGFQGPLRLVAQLKAIENLASNAKNREWKWSDGEVISSFGNKSAVRWQDISKEFAVGKMNPLAQKVINEFSPSRFANNDSIARSWLVPLFIQDMLDVGSATDWNPLQMMLTAPYLFAGFSATSFPKTGWDTFNDTLGKDEELRKYLKSGETKINYQNLDTDGKLIARQKYPDLYAKVPQSPYSSVRESQEHIAKIRGQALSDQQQIDQQLLAGRDFNTTIPNELDPRGWRETRSSNRAITRALLAEEYNDIPTDDKSLFSRYFDGMSKFTIPGQNKVDYEQFERWTAENFTQAERDRIDAYFRTKGQTEGTDLEKSYNRVVNSLEDAGFWDMRDQAWKEYATANGLTQYKTYYDWKNAVIDSIAKDLQTNYKYDPKLVWQDAEKEFNKLLANAGAGASWNDTLAHYESQFIAKNPDLAKDAIWWQFMGTNADQNALFRDPSALTDLNTQYAGEQKLRDLGFGSFSDTDRTSTNTAWLAKLSANKAAVQDAIKTGVLTLDSAAEKAAAGLTASQYEALTASKDVRSGKISQGDYDRLNSAGWYSLSTKNVPSSEYATNDYTAFLSKNKALMMEMDAKGVWKADSERERALIGMTPQEARKRGYTLTKGEILKLPPSERTAEDRERIK